MKIKSRRSWVSPAVSPTGRRAAILRTHLPSGAGLAGTHALQPVAYTMHCRARLCWSGTQMLTARVLFVLQVVMAGLHGHFSGRHGMDLGSEVPRHNVWCCLLGGKHREVQGTMVLRLSPKQCSVQWAVIDT